MVLPQSTNWEHCAKICLIISAAWHWRYCTSPKHTVRNSCVNNCEWITKATEMTTSCCCPCVFFKFCFIEDIWSMLTMGVYMNLQIRPSQYCNRTYGDIFWGDCRMSRKSAVRTAYRMKMLSLCFRPKSCWGKGEDTTNSRICTCLRTAIYLQGLKYKSWFCT